MSVKPNSGLFEGTQGEKNEPKQSEIKLFSINDRFQELSKFYPLDQSGKFGKQGKNHRVRVISSKDQYKTADHFWRILSEGSNVEYLTNGKGLQIKFLDGSLAVYRIVSSTKNSPAVDITFYDLGRNQKRYRIHFIGESNENIYR